MNFIDRGQLTPEEQAEADALMPQNLPNRSLVGNLSVDRTTSKPGGYYGKMLLEARKSDLKNHSSLAWLKTVPNSRYMWMHQLIQAFETNKKFGPLEVGYANSFWMEPIQKEAMINWMKEGMKYDTNLKTWTVRPLPGKSKIVPVNNKGELRWTLANPGILNLNLPTDILQLLRSMPDTAYVALNNAIHNLVLDYPKQGVAANTLQGVAAEKPDLKNIQEALSQIFNDEMEDDYDVSFIDPALFETLKILRREINNNTLTLPKLGVLAKKLYKFHMETHNMYLMSMLDPWNSLDGKIPNEVPIPTSSFKIRSTLNLTTNALGCVAWAWQPFFLGNVGAGAVGVNNNATLNGGAANNNFVISDMGQGMPAALYQTYRSVSAAMRVSIVSSVNNSSGFVTLGQDYLSNQIFGGVGNLSVNCATYGLFSNVENLYYHTTMSATPGAQTEIRYYPKDESFYIYQAIGGGVGLNLVGYASGLPASSSAIKLDFVLNIEGLINPAYTDYIPSTVYTGEFGDLKEARKHVIGSIINKSEPDIEKGYSNKLLNMAGALVNNPEEKPILIPPGREEKQTFWNSLLGVASKLVPIVQPFLQNLLPMAKSVVPF